MQKAAVSGLSIPFVLHQLTQVWLEQAMKLVK